jgi:hypothetical protein
MKNSSGLINSPQSPARAIHALRANALAQLPGNDSVENLHAPDEGRSVKSNARSLSISQNKISKIQRMDDTQSNALSKIKLSKAHKSLDRAVSRGRGDNMSRTSAQNFISERLRQLKDT